MRTIFISYRRSDSIETAGRMYDRLVDTFGPERVFKDVDSIPLDSQFQPYVLEKIRTSVVLALIGPQWVSCTDAATGSRRLDLAGDLVRLEIETAIACGAPLIPITVLRAAVPAAADLPASLRPLVERQAHAVRPDPDFHNDMERLIASLEGLAGEGRAPAVPREVCQDILATCQAWHTEIVTTLARISAELTKRGQDEERGATQAHLINFVYQNTRNHVPRLVSGRTALAQFAGTEHLVDAIDAFLAEVTEKTDGNAINCMMLPSSSLLLPGPSAADQVGGLLVRINQALQHVSDEVTALTASGQQSRRPGRNEGLRFWRRR